MWGRSSHKRRRAAPSMTSQASEGCPAFSPLLFRLPRACQGPRPSGELSDVKGHAGESSLHSWPRIHVSTIEIVERSLLTLLNSPARSEFLELSDSRKAISSITQRLPSFPIFNTPRSRSFEWSNVYSRSLQPGSKARYVGVPSMNAICQHMSMQPGTPLHVHRLFRSPVLFRTSSVLQGLPAAKLSVSWCTNKARAVSGTLGLQGSFVLVEPTASTALAHR